RTPPFGHPMGFWRGTPVQTRFTPSVSSSIPARTRAFCPDGDLGSSNRPFPRRRPHSVELFHGLAHERREIGRFPGRNQIGVNNPLPVLIEPRRPPSVHQPPTCSR